MGRFYVSDSLVGTGVLAATGPRNGSGRRRDLFRPSGSVFTLSAVEDFTPWTDFQAPLAEMSENFRPYFCGRKYNREPESRIRPLTTVCPARNRDIHDVVHYGSFRLPHTVHLFGLLKAPLSLGVVLSRRQPNLLYMMGTNQMGHLVVVTSKGDGSWLLDAQEPTEDTEWPSGTRIFFLD